MLYDMRCDTCKRTVEIGCPISMHEDIIVPGIECNEGNCHGKLKQIITPPRHMFVKEGFPGTGNEMQLPTPDGVDVKFRDKIECRDYLGERGLQSNWIENDM
jgi:hypothetical protein